MGNALAAAIAILAVMPSALGEAWVCAKTVDGMSYFRRLIRRVT